MSLKSMPKRRRRLTLPPDEYKALCDRIHGRDRWCCRVPSCRARTGLHAHHVVFRSQNGDDASYNLLTVCNNHHKQIHQYKLIILPLKEGEPINCDEGVRWYFVGKDNG